MASLSAKEIDAPLEKITLMALNSNEERSSSLQLNEHKLNAATMNSFVQQQFTEGNMIQKRLKSTLDQDEKQYMHLKRIEWIHKLAKVDFCCGKTMRNEADEHQLKHGLEELTASSLVLHDTLCDEKTSVNILNTIKNIVLTADKQNIHNNSFNEVVMSSSFNAFKNKELKKDVYVDVKGLAGIFCASYFGEIYELLSESINSIFQTFQNHTERWKQQAREQNDDSMFKTSYWIQKMEQMLNVIYKEELIFIKDFWPENQTNWNILEQRLFQMWNALLYSEINMYKYQINSIFAD
eukprot:116502_1